MNLKILMFAMTMTFSLSGFGSDLNINIEGQTKYQTLLQWYEDSEPIGVSNMEGYSPGRCYVERKNITLGASICREGSKNGPAFPGEEKFGLALTYDPTSFDGTTCVGSMYASWHKTTDFILEPTLHWHMDIEPNKRLDWKLSVVKNGDFLIMKVTNLITQKFNSSNSYGLSGTYNKGAVLYACYFFKSKFIDLEEK